MGSSDQTLAAVGRFPQSEVCSLFLALRGVQYAGHRNFKHYGLGWFKRLFLALWDAKHDTFSLYLRAGIVGLVVILFVLTYAKGRTDGTDDQH